MELFVPPLVYPNQQEYTLRHVCTIHRIIYLWVPLVLRAAAHRWAGCWLRRLIRSLSEASHHPSSMHHIFQIDELVKQITRHMFMWHNPQRIVLDWALTCKTISDPALDVLWETQDSLINLLKTLPSDIWEVNRRKLVGNSCPQDFTQLTAASTLLASPRVTSGIASRGIDIASTTYK